MRLHEIARLVALTAAFFLAGFVSNPAPVAADCPPGTIGGCVSLELRDEWCTGSCTCDPGAKPCCHAHHYWCNNDFKYYLTRDCGTVCEWA